MWWFATCDVMWCDVISCCPVLLSTTKYYEVLLRTTKYYASTTVLQSTTPVLQSTTPYYKVLRQYHSVLLQYYKVLPEYYSVLQSTTPAQLRTTPVLQSTTRVLLRTTKYYASTTLYYKNATTPVLLCTTPVLLRTTRYYASTTLYYKVLRQYYKVLQRATPYYKVLLSTTPYYKVLRQYYSVLQSTTPVLQSITPYYKVPIQYYKVLLQYYKVLLRTTRYYASTTLYYASTTKYYSVLQSSTLYYKLLRQYYSVLQSTTPVLQSTTPVTLELHQILRLSSKMTPMLDPGHIWNVIYNARSNKCHPPTSPNTAPATQNDSHAWSSSHMKRHLQCAEQQVSPSNLTKYCACHTEWLASLIVVTYETSFTMRGATGVTIQPHQILRLPHRMTRMLDRRHIWNVIYNARSNRCHHPTSPNTAPATQNDSTALSSSHIRSNQCLPPNSPNTAPATQNDHLTCGRNLRKTSMIRAWSDHENANRNPPRKWGYFSSSPGAFSIVKYNVSSPILHSNIHQVLRLPQKVTLDLHRILPLPRKVTLDLHRILPLPQK